MDDLSADVIAFLSEGTRTAMLGYVASDGRPLVAPAWFLVDGGELVVRVRPTKVVTSPPQRPGAADKVVVTFD